MKSTMTLQVHTDTLLELPAGCDPASVRGYQWKSMFLPEGTVLRSWSYSSRSRENDRRLSPKASPR